MRRPKSSVAGSASPQRPRSNEAVSANVYAAPNGVAPVRYHRANSAFVLRHNTIYVAVVESQLVAVTYDTQNPVRLAQFWDTMLGREPIEDVEGVLLPGFDGQLGLRFQANDASPNVRAECTCT
jgi:hypothetical protein